MTVAAAPAWECVARSVDALLALDEPAARAALERIDVPGLLAERQSAMERYWGDGGVARGYRPPQPGRARESVPPSRARAVLTRDRYTCRYSHCGRRTIATVVLKRLGTLFPDLLPCHRNWKPVETHALHWTSTASVEHVVPFPSGGTSAIENLVTSCYLCNDVKNSIPLEVLGWSVAPIADVEWDGLTGRVVQLDRAIARLRP